MKKNRTVQNFPIATLTSEKWWQSSKANHAFTKGETVKIIAGASCSSEDTGSSSTTTEGDNEDSTTKKTN